MFPTIAAMEICTKIQYNVRMQRQPALDAQRVRDEMKKLGEKLGHEVKPPELAELAGLVYETMFKAINQGGRRVAADLVARLALVFGCSIEFLMGLTDDRNPVTLNLNDWLDGLVKTAKTLPASRQRDLLLIARVYADTKEESARLAFQDTRGLISRAADEMGRGEDFDSLLKFLERAENELFPSSGLLSEDTGKPSD